MDLQLFKKQVKKIARKQKLKRLTFKGLLGLLVVLALTMVALSAWSLWLAKNNQELETNITNIKKKIDGLREIETKQVYLSSKLGSFKTLIATHEKHQAVTETVFALIPNGTTLKGFEVTEEGIISLSGTVPNFDTLNELLSRVRNPEAYELPILEAKMNRVVFSQQGSQVSFDLLVTIGVEKLKDG
ncbi:hypothetical protein ACFL18_02420 [Patescibacteria group bacterium]